MTCKKRIEVIDVITALAIAIIVLVVVGIIKLQPTDKEVQDVIDDLKCQPTNEFVGAGAYRLYLCGNGFKDTYSTFRQIARQKKKLF